MTKSTKAIAPLHDDTKVCWISADGKRFRSKTWRDIKKLDHHKNLEELKGMKWYNQLNEANKDLLYDLWRAQEK